MNILLFQSNFFSTLQNISLRFLNKYSTVINNEKNSHKNSYAMYFIDCKGYNGCSVITNIFPKRLINVICV